MVAEMSPSSSSSWRPGDEVTGPGGAWDGEDSGAGWEAAGPPEELTTDPSAGTTEVYCPNRDATPEELRQIQVITLVVIGVIGTLIVSFLLLCMFYKNDRFIESFHLRKRTKQPSSSGLDMSLVVNCTLHTIPAIRVSPTAGADAPAPGTGSPGGAPIGFGANRQSKRFPTPKHIMVDVSPLLPGTTGITELHQPASFADTQEIVEGGDAATASRFPEAPCNYMMARQAYNDTNMRRHHPGAAGGSLFGCSPEMTSHDARVQPEVELSSESGGSWYSDDTLESWEENHGAAGWEEEDEEDGYHAESRRGARGEKSRHSLHSKDGYSDNYGSSMSSRKGNQIADQHPPVSSGPHEVSYMSGRFW